MISTEMMMRVLPIYDFAENVATDIPFLLGLVRYKKWPNVSWRQTQHSGSTDRTNEMRMPKSPPRYHVYVGDDAAVPVADDAGDDVAVGDCKCYGVMARAHSRVLDNCAHLNY